MKMYSDQFDKSGFKENGLSESELYKNLGILTNDKSKWKACK